MAEFDDKAATWDDDPVRVQRAEEIAGFLANKIDLTKIGTVMEYGSGTGLLSFALKDKLPEVVLMDESAEMTRVARAKCAAMQVGHFKPLQYDLLKQPLPELRFDLIYILLTLHHIADTKAIMAKFHQLLNPGGFLVIIDLDKEDGSFHEGEFPGHHGFDRQVLADTIKAVGLQPVSYDICYELERETAGGVKKFPLFMQVAQKPA